MRKLLAVLTTGLVLAGAALVPASASGAETARAAAGEYVEIKTGTAIGYGSPYDSEGDGILEDWAFRPRMRLPVEVQCEAGRRAVVGFDPVTAHQGPQTPPFTCTGWPQEVEIIPASGQEAGTVKVSTGLYYQDASTPVAQHSRNVVVSDVRTSYAFLTAPGSVVRNKPLSLSSTIQVFTKGRWTTLGTQVAVRFRSGGDWTRVGTAVSAENGKVRFTTPPVTRAGDWMLTWSYGGQTWESESRTVTVTEPPVLPVAPPFWVGKVTRTTADVHWSAPKGAANITGYRFGWTSSNGKPVKAWQDDWPANARSPLTMINLHPGTTYTMWVRAITPEGLGRKATVKVKTLPAVRVVAPTAPRNLKATAGKRQVAVRWSAPAKTGGAPVTSYQVRLTSAGAKQHHTVAAKRTSLTVKGLKKGKAYSVTTRARNAAGWSTWAKARTVRVR